MDETYRLRQHKDRLHLYTTGDLNVSISQVNLVHRIYREKCTNKEYDQNELFSLLYFVMILTDKIPQPVIRRLLKYN